MFENKLTHNGIHYSRYIASWKREGGKIFGEGLFQRWLKETQELTDEEIRGIMYLATNGKFELEESARQFMKENDEEAQEERKVAGLGGIFEDCDNESFEFKKKWYLKLKEKGSLPQ